MPRVLYRGKECVTEQEAELASESVWNLWRREKSLAPAGSLVHKLVTALSHHRSLDPSNRFADFCTRLKVAKFQNTVIFAVCFHILFAFIVQENRIRDFEMTTKITNKMHYIE
jgi:hypothetical protein